VNNLKAINKRIDELEKLKNGGTAATGANAYPIGGSRDRGSNPDDRPCYFCSKYGHRQNVCAVKDKAVSDGKIRWSSQERSMVFADGTTLDRTLPGKDDRERIEKYLASHPQFMHATANLSEPYVTTLMHATSSSSEAASQGEGDSHEELKEAIRSLSQLLSKGF
jgi:hypothetical protein